MRLSKRNAARIRKGIEGARLPHKYQIPWLLHKTPLRDSLVYEAFERTYWRSVTKKYPR